MAKTDKDLLDGARLDAREDAELDAFFEAARADRAVPSEALMAAILTDAMAQLPQPQKTSQNTMKPQASVAPRSFLKDLIAQIGGWPALAGMATATVAGVWLGMAQPNQLEILSGGVILSGSYSATEATYALEDLVPNDFGLSNILSDEEAGA